MQRSRFCLAGLAQLWVSRFWGEHPLLSSLFCLVIWQQRPEKGSGRSPRKNERNRCVIRIGSQETAKEGDANNKQRVWHEPSFGNICIAARRLSSAVSSCSAAIVRTLMPLGSRSMIHSPGSSAFEDGVSAR
nr:hypothetical protein CFP56_69092 [Quercus suber]